MAMSSDVCRSVAHTIPVFSGLKRHLRMARASPDRQSPERRPRNNLDVNRVVLDSDEPEKARVSLIILLPPLSIRPCKLDIYSEAILMLRASRWGICLAGQIEFTLLRLSSYPRRDRVLSPIAVCDPEDGSHAICEVRMDTRPGS